MSKRVLALSVFCLLMLLVALLASPVEAFWFHGKDKTGRKSPADQIQTFQPPPPDAVETRCEKYRQQALANNRRPALVKFFTFNRITTHQIKKKHKACLYGIKQQELEYLRHVDKPQPPSLPPLQIDSATPPVNPAGEPVETPAP